MNALKQDLVSYCVDNSLDMRLLNNDIWDYILSKGEFQEALEELKGQIELAEYYIYREEQQYLEERYLDED